MRILALRLLKAGEKEYDVPEYFRPLEVDTWSGEIYLLGLCETDSANTDHILVKVFQWPGLVDFTIRERDRYVGHVTVKRFDYFVFCTPLY